MEPSEARKHDDGFQAAADWAMESGGLGDMSVGTVRQQEGDGGSNRLGAQAQEGRMDGEHSSTAAPNLSAVIGHLQRLFARMQYSKGRSVLTMWRCQFVCGRLHNCVIV